MLDIFAGSNTTGYAAEKLGRKWLAFEKDRNYLAASAFRFMENAPEIELTERWQALVSSGESVEVDHGQLRFCETPKKRGKSR